MPVNDSKDETGESSPPAPPMAMFGQLAIPTAEANLLSDQALVERLVESGRSRLTAMRIIETTRGQCELGRARRRPQARP